MLDLALSNGVNGVVMLLKHDQDLAIRAGALCEPIEQALAKETAAIVSEAINAPGVRERFDAVLAATIRKLEELN
jgi:hypothetical protein